MRVAKLKERTRGGHMFRALEAALKSKVAVVAAVGAIAVGGGAGIAARSAGTSPQFG
jgi:enoyl-CoA hydratase/carnithine racemase